MKEVVKQVSFAEYQGDITAMMLDMLHLEPQPVDIPTQRYIELDEMGVLKPFMWLDGDVAKGVALLFASPSLRNQAIVDASTDVMWVKPEYRGNSHIFIKGIKDQLKQMGVNYWYISSRDSHPIDRFLTKNNFEPLERLYFCQL